MNIKVVITVSGGHHYAPSHKDGKAFVSVSFQTSTYGAASPCDTEDEIRSAIAACQKSIRENGDIPIVVDNRMTLIQFV